MTVQELIDELEKLPEDAEVMLRIDSLSHSFSSDDVLLIDSDTIQIISL